MTERIVSLGNGNTGNGAADTSPFDNTQPMDAILTPLDGGLGMTDMGNAARFAERYASTVRFVHTWGRHVIWDGKRWKPDNIDAVIQKAKELTQEMFLYANSAAERRWCAQSGSAGRLKAMIDLANSDPRIAAVSGDFDAEPYLLNVDNGCLDLRTGELREHRQADMMSKISPAVYVPGARSELWERFLVTALPNEEVRDYVQRVAGSALIGAPSDQRFYLAQGPGSTGKSTFLNAVRNTLGDYAGAIDSDSLLKKAGDSGIRNDLASLEGLRYVMAVEPQEGKGWNAELLKQMTGGDPLKVRFLYREHFTYVPQFTLFVGANTLPAVPASDGAFWRRLRRIVFDTVIPAEQRDRTLPEKLRAPEGQYAILAWLVEGCMKYQANPVLVEPQAVLEATNEYREENDPLAEWINDRCVVGPQYRAKPGDLMGSYNGWCVTNSGADRIESKTKWNKALEARGFTARRGEGEKRQRILEWVGIGLKVNYPGPPR